MENNNDWWKNDKFLFGAIIIVGYMVGWFLTGFWPITGEQAQLFSQGLATLGPVVGLIAASIWKFGKDELEERKKLSQTISTLADKTPPPIVEENANDSAETIAIEGTVDGSSDAPWFSGDSDPNRA